MIHNIIRFYQDNPIPGTCGIAAIFLMVFAVFAACREYKKESAAEDERLGKSVEHPEGD